MKTSKLELKAIAKRELCIRKSRESFWMFCKSMNPKVYSNDKLFLKEICDTLQSLYEGKLLRLDGTPYKKFILNMPPGFAKSYTLTLFSQWCFGKDKENEIITVSYNEKLTSKFGATVRDNIEAERDITKLEISYNNIFPNTKIKYGDASKRDWAVEGRHHSYLATSFRGTLTGMRGNIGIIDDPVKSAEEAYNEDRLEENWLWYKDTFLSRMIEGAIQIVVCTRWANKDLCGKLLELEPDEWYVLKYEAMNEDTGLMLCDKLMSRATYEDKKGKMSTDIFRANYHQETIDIKGKLYPYFQEYTELPEKIERIVSYTDTADEGDDLLAQFIAAQYKGQLYILDIYYTKAAMEITEPEATRGLHDTQCNKAWIESNNGGRGFARNIERLLWDNHKSRHCKVEWFHQSANKKSRILTAATNICNNVFFPTGWKQKYKEAYDHLNMYQKEGKSKHDDIEDALTGLWEKSQKSGGWVTA
jgi:predicted phage terminase large subunit-like protein